MHCFYDYCVQFDYFFGYEVDYMTIHRLTIQDVTIVEFEKKKLTPKSYLMPRKSMYKKRKKYILIINIM